MRKPSLRQYAQIGAFKTVLRGTNFFIPAPKICFVKKCKKTRFSLDKALEKA